MSQTKTWSADKSAVVRWPAAGGTRTGCGKNSRLYVGRDGSYLYESYQRFALDWSGVGQIIKAELVLATDDGLGGKFPLYTKTTQTPRIYVRRLTSSFTEGNNADEHFDTSDATSPKATTSDAVAKSMTKAHDLTTTIDITAIVEDWAPSSVKRRSGAAGGKAGNYGLALVRRSTDADDQWSGWSRFGDDTSLRPKIILTYEEGHTTPDTPTNLTPSGAVASIGAFQGDFNDPRATDVLARTDVQIIANGSSKSGDADTDDTVDVNAHGYSVGTEVWFTSLTGGAGLSTARPYYVRSVVNANSFKVSTEPGGAVVNITTAYSALTVVKPIWSRLNVVPTNTEVINARSNVTPDDFVPVVGTNYQWRMRQRDQESQWSAWTSLVTFSVTNTDPNAPTLTPASGSDFPDGLTSVVFRGGEFSDPDNDSLLAYQVQLSAYPSGNANWDNAEAILWDTGKVYVVAGSTDWEALYTGQGLAAGTYYWRARQWDDKNGVSAWTYASLTTAAFNATPGTQPDIQIGPQSPWRVVIKEMKFNAVGGALTGVASTNLFTTASNHGLVAGQKVRFSTNLVGGAGLYPGRDYWVIASGLAAKTFRVSETEGGTTVDFTTDVTSGSITTVTTRGPGNVVAIFEHARSLGASKVYNSPGEMHFTLLSDDPQIAYVEPKQTHYSIQFYSGDGWRETYAGLVWDADANENDVVITGIDYLALFDLILDERYYPEDPDKSYINGGSYYSAKTIKTIVSDQLKRAIGLKNSPVGFISIGTLATMNESVTIYSTMQPALSFIAGLLDSHRQGTGKRTRIEVVRTSGGSYQVTVQDDPGVVRDHLRLAYGELVQGYRVIPFGRDWASVQHGIGRTREGIRVLYKTASAPGIDQQVWGRIARASIMDNVSDEKDLERRVKQAAIHAGKLGKGLGLALRSGVLGPMAGYDVCDVVPVNIVHGAIDTNRFGSGYWAILAVAWEAGDDASQNTILTLAPREDSTAPDDDLLQTAGNTSTQAEWQIGWTPPNPLEATSKYWLDQSTGKVYVRDVNVSLGSMAVTGVAATDTFTSVAHGLNPGDRIVFKVLVPAGTGLITDVPYYVSANGLTADAFKVTDDEIDDFDLLVDLTSGTVTLIARAVTGTA